MSYHTATQEITSEQTKHNQMKKNKTSSQIGTHEYRKHNTFLVVFYICLMFKFDPFDHVFSICMCFV